MAKKTTKGSWPAVPSSESPEDLGFQRQLRMVRWFGPVELVRSGVKSLLAALFGAYADNRELQAALEESKPHGPCDTTDTWVDFVADTGDGWHSTYTVARLLAEETLELELDGTKYPTRRGQILIMGGDQVYPTANREEYQNRLVGPFRSALPWVDEDKAPCPRLFAIPGNHDWYDGLTSFKRLFCTQRWIGGWKTEQNRSYYAIEVGHGWWIWGIDVQLDSDIDLPQFDYFRKVARDIMPKGSKILLACAEPSWVYQDPDNSDFDDKAYKNLGYFERKAIHEFGHHFVVGLAGDLHTYARYEESARGRQRFVSGGGGAYLYGSHNLPERLTLPAAGAPRARSIFGCEALHPKRKTSRWLALGSLLFPIKSWSFSLLLGFIYLWYAWVAQGMSRMQAGGVDGMTFLEAISKRPPGLENLAAVVSDYWGLVAHSPGSFVMLALLFAGLVGFADFKSLWKKTLAGVVHATLHVMTLITVIWVSAWVCLALQGHDVDSFRFVVSFGALIIALGFVAGGLLFGAYLFVSNLLFKAHINEVFVCQAIPNYKNFLRLHFDSKGQLTIYPIAIDKVPRKWELMSEAKPGEAWFEPLVKGKRTDIASSARLIERPVAVNSFSSEPPAEQQAGEKV